MTDSDKRTNDDSNSVKHIAIVMDGNGRWAKKRFMPRAAGHKAGVTALKNIVEYLSQKNTKALTVFAFSSENWNRPAKEVGLLMELFVSSIRKHIDGLLKAGVRLRFIGERSSFSADLLKSLEEAEEITRENTGLQFTIAISYGGRWDIANATKQLLSDVQSGMLQLEDIDEFHLGQYISLADLPPVDLFIRTGGEQRISNFLLWQIAYSEFYFSELLWPDFNPEELENALSHYAGRQRRFGRTGEQVESDKNSAEVK